MGDGKDLGFRFVLKIESSKGFTDELVLHVIGEKKKSQRWPVYQQILLKFLPSN